MTSNLRLERAQTSVETATRRLAIDRVYPLAEIAEAAARLSAGGSFGKFVLDVAG